MGEESCEPGWVAGVEVPGWFYGCEARERAAHLEEVLN